MEHIEEAGIHSGDSACSLPPYSLKENTIRAFTAGCNLVLHCNGNIKEMTTVANNSPFITKFIRKKNTNLNLIFG